LHLALLLFALLIVVSLPALLGFRLLLLLAIFARALEGAVITALVALLRRAILALTLLERALLGAVLLRDGLRVRLHSRLRIHAPRAIVAIAIDDHVVAIALIALLARVAILRPFCRALESLGRPA